MGFSPLRLISAVFAAALLSLGATSAPAAAAVARSAHVEAELVAETLAVAPGQAITVGLRLKMDPHWHTYWVNSGDSGMPTSIAWKLPDGFKAGPIQWPAPQLVPTPPFMTFGYEGEVVLLTQIEAPATLPDGPVRLAAHVEWLECRESCMPGAADLALELPRGDAARPDPARAALFAEARRRLPVVGGADWPATFQLTGSEILLRVKPPAGADFGTKGIYFFPLGESVIEPAAPQTAQLAEGVLSVRIPRAKTAPATPDTLAGVLTAPDGFPPRLGGRALQLAAQPAAGAQLAAGATASAGATAPRGLGGLAVLAFLGGLVLNLMPCVFPVLGIKILGFVNQAGADRRKVTLHGLVFALGVLVSFWALAAVLIALRAGGQQLGWGFQLQSPGFVFGLAVLLLVFGLNLSGVFEVGLAATSVGGALRKHSGFTGSFFSGVLATIVATPCAAPFLASALGAALTLPAASSLLLFTVIGLGLATPYLVLSAAPRLVKVLPRPGAWMETFKQLMAFPLYATVGFLVWVLAGQVSEGSLLKVFFGLVLVALAGWAYGRWTQRAEGPHAGFWRGFGAVFAAVALAAGLLVAFPRAQAAGEIAWQPWSPEAVASLRAEGRPLYVDFTARWCATCQSNKALVFASGEVREAFREHGIVPLKADWTNRDARITQALADHGRSAVPFNLVYPAGGGEPIVLPEVLTPGIVLEALERATAVRTTAAGS